MDANFLIALGYPHDKYHALAKNFVLQNELPFLIPDVILPEVMYNLKRVGGMRGMILFAQQLKLSNILIPLLEIDFDRSISIMQMYESANLDFVDCCLIAQAERLEITKIATFDRRDFSIIRPRHAPYLELYP